MRKQKIFLLFLGITLGLLLSGEVWASDGSSNHEKMGNTYLKQNKVREATREYKLAIESNPKVTNSYFNLAIAYFSERNLPEAISTLEALVKLDPNDTEAEYNLASLKLYQGNWEEAGKLFEKVKICCDQNSPFAPKIKEALEYIQELSLLDSGSRALVLFRLQLEKDLTPGSVAF